MGVGEGVRCSGLGEGVVCWGSGLMGYNRVGDIGLGDMCVYTLLDIVCH